MAKYKIYNNEEVITPIGEILTSEQWLTRYPWAKTAKMIVGGGTINGSCALVFDDYVEMVRKNGCDFSDCTTDSDILARIEEFEDRMVSTASDQARIADALEDLIVIQEISAQSATE